MENLDFGWGFAVIVMAIMVIGYFAGMIVNYLLVVFIGGKIKKRSDPSPGHENRSLLATLLPYVLAAVIVRVAIIPFDMLQRALPMTRSGLFDSLSTGHLGYIIELSCLALTRFSYSRNWKALGPLHTRRIVFNFILWSVFNLILISVFRYLSQFHYMLGMYLNLLYLPAVPGITFLFLKVRNMEKPVRTDRLKA